MSPREGATWQILARQGIDIAGTIRDIKNKFNFKGNALGADQKKRTDFSEMIASFKITNGVAHNDDLSIKSPLLRIGGSGDIDIGNDRIDYLARISVVNTTTGQEGKDLAKLKGITVPLRLRGPFSRISYSLELGSVIEDVVKEKVKEEVKKQLGEQLKGLFGR